MYISKTFSISFNLPEEAYVHDDFVKRNDMSDWQKSICTLAVTYTKRENHKIEVNHEQSRRNGNQYLLV